MGNRSGRLSKNLTTLFGSTGARECRVCKNPLGNHHRKYCSDKCQRVAYAVSTLYQWNAVRKRVLARDNYRCVNPACRARGTNSDVTLAVDHITPIDENGAAHDPANLQTLCTKCNSEKGTADRDYRPNPRADGGLTTATEYGRDNLRELAPDRFIAGTDHQPPENAPGRPGPSLSDLMPETETNQPETETDTDQNPDPETETSDDETIEEAREMLLDSIDNRPVGDIFPYVNNPKEHPDHQVEKIASSIKQFGFDQPIVIDGDGEIIKGHGRYQAAKRLGLDRVPVITRDDLTDAQARASRLADNKTQMESGWDVETLAAEFDQLDTDPTGDIDLSDTAFEDDEIDAILDQRDFDIDEFFEAEEAGEFEDDSVDHTGDAGGDEVPGDLEVECPSCGHQFWPEERSLEDPDHDPGAVSDPDPEQDLEPEPEA